MFIAFVALLVLLQGGPLQSEAASQTRDASPIVVPGQLEIMSDRLRSQRAEYLVTPTGAAEGNTYLQHLQIDRGYHQRRPVHMIHWIGIDPDNTVDDLTTVDSETFALVHRFMPQSLGTFFSFALDRDKRVLRGSKVAFDEDPTTFVVEEMPPTFSLVTFPYLLAAVETEEGASFRLPIMALGRVLKGEAGVATFEIINRGPAEFRDTQGARYQAVHFEMAVPGGLTWSYYVTAKPPYFLGLISRVPDGSYDIRYTGRSGALPVSGDDRLDYLLEVNPEDPGE